MVSSVDAGRNPGEFSRRKGIWKGNWKGNSSAWRALLPWLLAVAILLLGIFLRLHELGEESLWVDEAFTYDYAQQDFPKLLETLRNEVHPILFYALEHWWTAAFGYSEFSLRFLPFVFGCLAIAAMFLLAGELYGLFGLSGSSGGGRSSGGDYRESGKRGLGKIGSYSHYGQGQESPGGTSWNVPGSGWGTALLSMLLFSISYTMVLYSQEAKMYMQFLFFFIAGLWLLLRFAKYGRLRDLLLMALVNALMLHTHFLSFVVLPAEIVLYFWLSVTWQRQKVDVLHALFGWKSKLRPLMFAASLLLLLLAYLPWLPILLSQLRRLLGFVLREKFFLRFGFDWFYAAFAGALVFGMAILILGFWIAYDKRAFRAAARLIKSAKMPPMQDTGGLQRTRQKQKSLQLAFFVALMLAFIGYNLLFHEKYFGNVTIIRYSIFLIPLLHIALARRMFALPRRLFAAMLILYLAASAIILSQYYNIDGKEQWREAAEYVQSLAGPQDVLFFHRAGHTWWAFNYYYLGSDYSLWENYLGTKPPIMQPFPEPQPLSQPQPFPRQVKLHTPADVALLDLETAGKEQAFLILSHNFRTKDFFKEEMDRRYTLLGTKEFKGIKIYQYLIEDNRMVGGIV